MTSESYCNLCILASIALYLCTYKIPCNGIEALQQSSPLPARRKESTTGRLIGTLPFYRRHSLLPFMVSKNQQHSTHSQSYIPRRAVLYVPADDERKIQKIPSLHVDCAVLDCEDGVALTRK
ncbi:Citramalyl-CoA lyase, mitochondrial, partial [Varanus komodoensis]